MRKLYLVFLSTLIIFSANIAPGFWVLLEAEEESLLTQETQTNTSDAGGSKDEILNEEEIIVPQEEENKTIQDEIIQGEVESSEETEPIEETSELIEDKGLLSIEESFVIPQETDYAITGGKITGLKNEFINSLSQEQKDNLHLIIPGSINGILVTEIADNAFKSPTNYKITYLDISAMTGLKIIGSWAFYGNNLMEGSLSFPDGITTLKDHAFDGASKLSGDLILPDSITTVGTYAFSNCSGLKGSLKLSNQLTTLSNYAFAYTPLTGELIIPDSVKTIGDSVFRQNNGINGFSGEVVIPDSVTSIGKVTFSYQNGITGVQFSSNMTTIPDSLFRYCKGLAGVLVIPEHIQFVGNTAFAETNLKTVYLPKMKDSTSTTFISNSSFTSCNNLTAIVAQPEDYEAIGKLLTTNAVKVKLTYEKTIQPQDDQGNAYDPLLKLYNFKYNFEKQTDGSWISNSSYKLPSIVGDDNHQLAWTKEKGSVVVVDGTTLVGNETNLYVAKPLEDPIINYSDDIDKVYDGQVATLSVAASHPLYKPIKEAKDGDVVFYYTWKWATIGGSTVSLKGFDENEFDILDVINPEYGIIMSVTVQTCLVKGTSAVPFKTVVHDFGVNLRQADPVLDLEYKNEFFIEDGVPALTLKEGSSEGTIEWIEGQEIKEGIMNYQWKYTPIKNSLGKYNYKEVSGEASIHAKHRRFNITINHDEYGSTSAGSNASVIQGKDLVLTILPNPDYRIESFVVDGKDCLNEVVYNQYVFSDVQQDHLIDVTFTLINPQKVEDAIVNLPDIKEDEEVTEDDAIKILEAKLGLESLSSESQSQVSQEAKETLDELLLKLPQVNIASDSVLDDSKALLSNISKEDIVEMLKSPNVKVEVKLVSEETKPQDEEIKLIEDKIDGGQMLNFFDINIKKTLEKDGEVQELVISNLTRPITLNFEVPTNLPPVEQGYTREFSVVRIHEENGNKETTILKNLSDDETKIKIKSDSFSIYALIYKDSTTAKPTPNPGFDSKPVEETQRIRNDVEGYVVPNTGDKMFE